MSLDDPAVAELLRRSKVARIATSSRTGRPSVNPLYVVVVDGELWLGTPDWTLAARNVAADARVSVLLQPDHGRDRRVLQILGRATVNTDPRVVRSYARRVARRYVLNPAGIANLLRNLRLLPLRKRYYAQSRERGSAAVIVVHPETTRVVDLDAPFPHGHQVPSSPD